MVKSRILIPRRNIIEFHESLDDHGGMLVTLDNGMVTDVYLDDLNNYRSITNNKHIISHLDYYGLEILNENVTLKEIMFTEDNEYKKIRLEIKIKKQDPMHKVELYYNELEKTSVNKFLLYDDSDIDLELLKEIEEAINYFLLDIEGITNTMFSVVTNETKLIDKLKQLGYVDNTGFINAYDNPNVGEYLLEKKLT